jgi:signal transduction histidine kinase
MTSARSPRAGDVRSIVRPPAQGGLFWKYASIFAAVLSLALISTGLLNVWFMYGENRADLFRIQSEQASAAAEKITQFVTEIEAQLGWMTHFSWAVPAMDQRELDGRRLLRQVPAITELMLLDPDGREKLYLSRQTEDSVASNADHSGEQKFKVALADKVYYGPVYFRRQTEPYMTLAVAGARRDSGVSVAEVNLKHIWDVVSQIRVGQSGRAYVVGPNGRLIAHPDISLVLRNTDLSSLSQITAARTAGAEVAETSQSAFDLSGQRVLTTYAMAKPLDWLVFVELPEQEANARLIAALRRSLFLTLAGLGLALVSALLLARRMVIPIKSLAVGAEHIGTGMLDHRITIKTGDELEALGEQFNRMASQLQGSYASLERKVEERTQQLQAANQAKSRFLAVASHDLRQPLHALNLFVAQWCAEEDPAERERLTQRIASSVTNMNDLFNALLDISRLDAGALTPDPTIFPIENVLARVEETFSAAAREKGLHLRVVHSGMSVRSDPILLERILLNLVSNAVRYTAVGGLVVGCRRDGEHLRIEVWDSGPGIAEHHQRSIFGEFYRIETGDQNRGDGLGLGLAIVERLCTLLHHPLTVSSTLGKGSRFSVSVPLSCERATRPAPEAPLARTDPLVDKLIVVMDDDPLVLDGTRGLLTSWGCKVVIASSSDDALIRLAGASPHLIISDFHLSEGRTGIGAIESIRRELGVAVPAFIVSGDVSIDREGHAAGSDFQLLHKPVSPMVLRAMMSALLGPRARP